MNIKNSVTLFQVVLCVVFTRHVRGADPIDLASYSSHIVGSEVGTRTYAPTVIEVFNEHFEDRLIHLSTKRFRQFELQRITHFQSVADGNADLNRRALRTMEKSALYSLREMVADSPPVIWIEEHHRLVGEFLKNSIDWTDEEEIRGRETPSVFDERVIERVSRVSSIEMGVRPFNAHPSVYASFRIRYHNHVRGVVVVRTSFDWVGLDNTKADVSYFLPVTKKLFIGVGYSQEILDRDGQKMTARLHYRISQTSEFGLSAGILPETSCRANLLVRF